MPNLVKHLIQFCVSYLACTGIVVAVTNLLNFDAPSSMGIVSLMASTTFPMQSFVKDQQRLPTKSERSQFAIFGTLASLALSIIFVLGFLAVYQIGLFEFFDALKLGDIPVWLWVLIAVLVVALSWTVIYFFSGFMAKQALKQAAKLK